MSIEAVKSTAKGTAKGPETGKSGVGNYTIQTDDTDATW